MFSCSLYLLLLSVNGNEKMDKNQQERRSRGRGVLLAGGYLFGNDIGATSGALVSLKSAATSGTDW